MTDIATQIQDAFAELEEKGFITCPPIFIGVIEDEIIQFGTTINEIIECNLLYFTGDAIRHSQRQSKVDAGICVPKEKYIDFPETKKTMSIFYDFETHRYTYTDFVNKFIVQPNVKIKLEQEKVLVVSLVTASKVRDASEFGMKKYLKIK